MKRLAITLGIIWMMLPASLICAAGNGREDDGGFFTWLFIGLCALIVVLQVLPALMRMMGLARETKVHEQVAEQREE